MNKNLKDVDMEDTDTEEIINFRFCYFDDIDYQIFYDCYKWLKIMHFIFNPNKLENVFKNGRYLFEFYKKKYDEFKNILEKPKKLYYNNLGIEISTLWNLDDITCLIQWNKKYSTILSSFIVRLIEIIMLVEFIDNKILNEDVIIIICNYI